MRQLLDWITQVGHRHLLIGVVGLLLVLNLGRWGISYFESCQEELSNRISLLEQYQDSIHKLPILQQRVKQLQQKSQRLNAYLFLGSSEEKIASAMQIKLQAEISNSGMIPEFVQPVRTTQRQYPGVDNIGIKVRISGTLNQFMVFLQNLYRSKQLFKIESFTIKPNKRSELKIFMEVRGFYKLKNRGGRPQ